MLHRTKFFNWKDSYIWVSGQQTLSSQGEERRHRLLSYGIYDRHHD